MKHPLHKLSKKTRNVISASLVGLATLFLISYYLQLPGRLLLRYFLASLLFVFLIIVLAVLAIALIKLVSAGIKKLSGSHDDDDPLP